MIAKSFYNRVTQLLCFTIDAAAGDPLMNKTEDETYNLINEMVLNNYQWSDDRGQPKRVGGKLEVDALALLTAKVDAMTQRVD